MKKWIFLHVNDIHLGSPRSYRYRPALHHYWKAIKDQICKVDSEFLLNGGDLTRDGDTHEIEYQFVKDELETLPFPTFNIPGNMDVGNKHTRVQGPTSTDNLATNMTSERLSLFAGYFGPIQWTFISKGVRFTGFYAATAGSGLPEEEKLWRFLDHLSQLPKTRHHVAMMHYWLNINHFDEKNWDCAKKEEYLNWYFCIDRPHRCRIMDALRKAGVTIVLSGHVHTGRPVEKVDGIEFYKTPSTGNCPQLTDQWEIRETRPGFQLCEVYDDKIDISFVPCDKTFDMAEGCYGPGGHPKIETRDYSLSAEKPSLEPDPWLLKDLSPAEN